MAKLSDFNNDRKEFMAYVRSMKGKKKNSDKKKGKGLFGDIGNYFGEDSKEKSIFESGPFKGYPKYLIHAGQLLPGTAQGIRLYKSGTKVID